MTGVKGACAVDDATAAGLRADNREAADVLRRARVASFGLTPPMTTDLTADDALRGARTKVLATALAFLAAMSAGPGARSVGSLSLEVGHGGLGALTVSLVVAVAGLIPLLLLLLVRRRDRRALLDLLRSVRNGAVSLTSWYLWTAGLLGGLFTAVQAGILPLMGVAHFAIAVVAGRTVAALIVDHVGLAHGQSRRVTAPRVLAALVTVLAVAVPLFGRTSGATASFVLTVVAALMGGSLAVQGAAGSHLREASTPIAAAVVIYLVTIVLLAAVVVPWVLATSPSMVLPAAVWPYCGGPLGLISLLVPIALIRHVGVLVVTTAVVSGQITASLVVDALWPLGGQVLQLTGLLAGALTLLGVALSLSGAGKGLTREPGIVSGT